MMMRVMMKNSYILKKFGAVEKQERGWGWGRGRGRVKVSGNRDKKLQMIMYVKDQNNRSYEINFENFKFRACLYGYFIFIYYIYFCIFEMIL